MSNETYANRKCKNGLHQNTKDGLCGFSYFFANNESHLKGMACPHCRTLGHNSYIKNPKYQDPKLHKEINLHKQKRTVTKKGKQINIFGDDV
jgi:hypothetical protein